jgi:predicted amidophosphoribosyltransferase
VNLFNAILDYFYPPRCLLCEKPGKHPLCNDCLTQFEPRPSTFSLSMFNVLTILPYQNAVRDLIHIGKFEGHEELWNLLAEITAPYLYGLEKRVLVPVPIHPLRIRERGFNQSAIIAKRLSRILGWEYHGRLIRRKKTANLNSNSAMKIELRM